MRKLYRTVKQSHESTDLSTISDEYVEQVEAEINALVKQIQVNILPSEKSADAQWAPSRPYISSRLILIYLFHGSN